jgi:hypothetical protein
MPIPRLHLWLPPLPLAFRNAADDRGVLIPIRQAHAGYKLRAAAVPSGLA